MDRFLYHRGWYGRLCRAAAVVLTTAALFSPGVRRHDARPVLFSLMFPQLMEEFPWYTPYDAPAFRGLRRGASGMREVLL
ncbi:MAG: hypothetical protein J6K32_09770 [Clostridia bacterium]|nr:hypothetical protein [Clostridia bacterium]